MSPDDLGQRLSGHVWTEAFAGRGRFPAVCRRCRIRENDPGADAPCPADEDREVSR